MSVYTQADSCLEETSRSLHVAITELSNVVIARVSGSDQYTHDHRVKLREVLSRLIEARDQLEGA